MPSPHSYDPSANNQTDRCTRTTTPFLRAPDAIAYFCNMIYLGLLTDQSGGNFPSRRIVARLFVSALTCQCGRIAFGSRWFHTKCYLVVMALRIGVFWEALDYASSSETPMPIVSHPLA